MPTTAKAEYTPHGFTTITPFLIVENADQVLEFVKNAFDAEELMALRHDNGTLWHAQVRINDAIFMLADSMGEKSHTMTAALYLYVPDADAAYKKALAAGATSISEPADQFYGDRNAGVRDASGNVWWIATKIENLTPDEMLTRGKQWERKHSS